MEVSTKQLQIAELAAARPEESFTSLNHYLDMDWMKEAYRRTRRESAAGVDGKTMEQYGKELESNLRDLIGRAKSGRYHAPPVRRVHIPKGDGKETRPIGIPTPLWRLRLTLAPGCPAGSSMLEIKFSKTAAQFASRSAFNTIVTARISFPSALSDVAR